MADILYVYKTSIYANLTNKCPCRCTFCIRNNTDSVGSADTLWHKHDPSMEDIKKAVDDFDFTGYKELVFCGYGEPTSALDNMLETAKYVREKHPDIKLRLNTNGLSDRINNKPTAELISSILILFQSASIPVHRKSMTKFAVLFLTMRMSQCSNLQRMQRNILNIRSFQS